MQSFCSFCPCNTKCLTQDLYPLFTLGSNQLLALCGEVVNTAVIGINGLCEVSDLLGWGLAPLSLCSRDITSTAFSFLEVLPKPLSLLGRNHLDLAHIPQILCWRMTSVRVILILELDAINLDGIHSNIDILKCWGLLNYGGKVW